MIKSGKEKELSGRWAWTFALQDGKPTVGAEGSVQEGAVGCQAASEASPWKDTQC